MNICNKYIKKKKSTIILYSIKFNQKYFCRRRRTLEKVGNFHEEIKLCCKLIPKGTVMESNRV